MAYDEGLHERVEAILTQKIDFHYKKMFGGICYLLNGNMLGGIVNDELIIRAGKDLYEELLEQEYTHVFDITGKIMKGWVVVSPDGLEKDSDLESWLNFGVEFAGSLPVK